MDSELAYQKQHQCSLAGDYDDNNNYYYNDISSNNINHGDIIESYNMVMIFQQLARQAVKTGKNGVTIVVIWVHSS